MEKGLGGGWGTELGGQAREHTWGQTQRGGGGAGGGGPGPEPPRGKAPDGGAGGRGGGGEGLGLQAPFILVNN